MSLPHAIAKLFFFKFLIFLNRSTTLLTGNVPWTKMGSNPAMTARAEPTIDAVARFSVKPPNQSIAAIELNDAFGGTTAQTMGATKNNANGVVLDNVPPTNDDKLDHLASGIACQERREECSLGKTGTTMCC